MADPAIVHAVVEGTEAGEATIGDSDSGQDLFHCDRCGFPMLERNCKLICPNCGGRVDCSDLSIYMD